MYVRLTHGQCTVCVNVVDDEIRSGSSYHREPPSNEISNAIDQPQSNISRIPYIILPSTYDYIPNPPISPCLCQSHSHVNIPSQCSILFPSCSSSKYRSTSLTREHSPSISLLWMTENRRARFLESTCSWNHWRWGRHGDRASH